MTRSSQHVLIAANPKSGAVSSGQRVAQLQAAIRSAGFECQVIQSLEQLQRESAQLTEKGELRAVVSAGGDGTVGALANLLPRPTPLLIFPLGTENLLAKHVAITGEIAQACRILQADVRLSLDVGSANGKLFLVMLSCGFDAEVVHQMHAIRTGHIRRWSYAGPILTALRKYRFPQLQFAWTEQALDLQTRRSGSAAWLFVFNVPRYAAALNFCPQADPLDGRLDLCTFQHSGVARGFGYLMRLWHGSHQRMRGFSHVRCQRLEIAAPCDRQGQMWEVPYQIDGDPGGLLPLTIEVLPKRLTLLVPESQFKEASQ